MAAKRDGKSQVTVVAFGDGASVQGTFHESLNLAAIWRLPILFVCENNLYAESTPVEYFSAPAEIYRKALVYGIPSVRVDGQDVGQVFKTTAELIAEVRQGQRGVRQKSRG